MAKIKRYEIELEGLKSEKQFYSKLKKHGVMPDDAGENLDALHDILTDITDEIEVFFLDTVAVSDNMIEFVDRLAEMCEDIESECSGLAFFFW